MIHHILSLLILVPVIGAVAVLMVPSSQDQKLTPYVGLGVTLLTFLLSGVVLLNFDPTFAGIQHVESLSWLPSLNIRYIVGVDGLSVSLLFLTALLFLLGVVASFEKRDGIRGYFSLFLFLESTIIGTLAAQDLFLFFMFWGASLFPIYFLVGVWGNKNRESAATRFFLYQLGGSVLLLLGILITYYLVQPHSLNLMELTGGRFSDLKIPFSDRMLSAENIIFVLMFLGFAVRFIAFPLHGWFIHVQSEAPVALTVILAALFIKTGAYGLVRVSFSLFPAAAAHSASFLAALGVVNILYGAICAFNQRDIRKLIAYSCVTHLGYVLLGLGSFSSTGFHGAFLQMFSHGIYTALLFFLAGILIMRSGKAVYETDEKSPVFGGLVSKAPIYTGFFTIAMFSSFGAPGFGGFSSELLVLMGSYVPHRGLTLVALTGLFLTAIYMLFMFRKVFLGPAGEASNHMSDINAREKVYLVPLILLVFFVGIFPTPIMTYAQPTVKAFLKYIGYQR